MNGFIWPEVFLNKKFKYKGKDKKRRALADGLCGWGICYGGGKPPENFGIGMVKIGKVLNSIVSPENLMKLAKKHEKQND